jgi:hypothetical protein
VEIDLTELVMQADKEGSYGYGRSQKSVHVFDTLLKENFSN